MREREREREENGRKREKRSERRERRVGPTWTAMTVLNDHFKTV